MKKIALTALTEKGFLLGEKISAEYENIDLYSIKKRKDWDSSISDLDSLLAKLFKNYDGLIFIMATGIVVRKIAGLLESKGSDPAIIVLDEMGNNVISLLSGHLGGANKLTKQLASFLDANPVITTATDVNKLYAIDSFATDYGLYPSPLEKIKIFNSMILDKEEIDIIIDEEVGLKKENFAEIQGFNFINYQNYQKKDKEASKKPLAYISHKKKAPFAVDLFLRPKNILIGTGCRKDYPVDKYEKNFLNFLDEENISIDSIKEIRSFLLKKDEICILEFAKKYKIPFITYSAHEINKVYEEHTGLDRSEFVYKNAGVYGVAEAVTLIEPKDGTINITERIDSQGMTLAAAKIPYQGGKKDDSPLRRNN